MIYLPITFTILLVGSGLGIFISTYYYPNIPSLKLVEYFYITLPLALILLLCYITTKKRFLFILFFTIPILLLSLTYSSIKSKQRLDNLLKVNVEPTLNGKVKVSFLNKIFVETSNFTVIVYLKNFDKEFTYIGSDVLITGRTKHIYHYLTNKNMYGYFIYLFSKNVPFVLYTEEEKIGEVSKSESRFLSTINAIKQDIFNKFSKYLPHTSSISSSLIMGESSEISKEFRENIRISGISHIFSVSGFHVGVISFAFVLFMNVFRIPKIIQFLVISIFLIGYSLIVGLKPPVVRASILASAILLIRSFNNQPNYINVISIIGIIMLILDPFLSVDIGFILSFLSTIGIILFSGYVNDAITRKLNKHNIEPGKLLKGIITLFSVSLVSVLVTLPIVILWFGASSITGILSSIILVPLSSLNITGGIIAYLSSLIIPPVAEYIFRTVNLINIIFMIITEMFSKIGILVSFNISNIFIAAISFTIYYSLLGVLFLITTKRVTLRV